MANQVSQEVRRELAATGAALGVVWGGPRKQCYYTPSGEEVWAIPSIREWVRKNSEGKIIAQGERDANLDKGWTLTLPAELKVHCWGCDGYHDGEEEVAACAEKKRAAAAAWERKARQMVHPNGGPSASEQGAVAELNEKVDRLTALVEQLLQGKEK